MATTPADNRRILLIDDNEAIHDDFRKVLCGRSAARDQLAAMEAALFGEPVASASRPVEFLIESALQGEQGFELVKDAKARGAPFALAFVDMRMPPGWDGLETVRRLWEVDDELQVVFCTAYSDCSWSKMVAELGHSERWLILKKPFDNAEVIQLASALVEKWNLSRRANDRVCALELAVAERTEDLARQNAYLEDALARLQEAHAQLLQSDKMASIGQLAAGVAHEINNPLGFISSNLNSLKAYLDDILTITNAQAALLDACLAGASPHEQAEGVSALIAERDYEYVLSDVKDLVNESIDGARRVRQIVADLRDFSHVDAPDVTEEDVNGLLEKTINVAWNELKYKTEVVRQFGVLPLLPCYGGKLNQVFLNLLVNAAHAIEERGVITVRTDATEDALWVEIQDTGCGIPPANLSRIFEPFFTTKDVGRGTGLGLHLAHTIVVAHGGEITVRSVVGQGSTFRVELPLCGPPQPAVEGDANE